MLEQKDMIKVIGIDPAPSKESTVFDGEEFKSFGFKQLKNYFSELNDDKLLICWDAPLSFNPKSSSPFTKRDIERFFSIKEWSKTPKGISVMGYSTCPHWMISQYLLGYPDVTGSNHHLFKLVFDKTKISRSITEVHPAVALWVWLKEDKKLTNWNYKKDRKILKLFVEILINKQIIPKKLETKITNDDDLDAYIAWKLGKDWLADNNTVEILGNNDTGSFLLPCDKNIFNKFSKAFPEPT